MVERGTPCKAAPFGLSGLFREVYMIAKLSAHPDQIRWYVESAINGFDTLEAADAIENAKADLLGLLEYIAYLEGADNTVPVLRVGSAETWIGRESLVR